MNGWAREGHRMGSSLQGAPATTYRALPSRLAIAPGDRAWLSRLAGEPDVDVLLLGEAEELAEAFLAADAGLLDSAERSTQVVTRHIVDPDVTRLDSRGGPVRGGQVARPDGAGEAVADRVDALQ